MSINQLASKLNLLGQDLVYYNSFSIITNGPKLDRLEYGTDLQLHIDYNNKLNLVEKGFGKFSLNDYFTYIVDTYGRLHHGLYIKDSKVNLLKRYSDLIIKGFNGCMSVAHIVGKKESKVVLVETKSKNFLFNYRGNKLAFEKCSKSESRSRGMLAILSRDNCNTYDIGYGYRSTDAPVGMPQPVSDLSYKLFTVDSELNIIRQ